MWEYSAQSRPYISGFTGCEAPTRGPRAFVMSLMRSRTPADPQPHELLLALTEAVAGG